MGFTLKPKVYPLTWDEGDYAGFEITMSSIPIAELGELAATADAVEASAGMRLLTELQALVVSKTLSWNMEDSDGTPVPPSVEHLGGIDYLDLTLDIIAKWMEAMVGVSVPLAQRSTGGDPSVEPSIPMEIGLPALAS